MYEIHHIFAWGVLVICVPGVNVILWLQYILAPNPPLLGAISARMFVRGPIF